MDYINIADLTNPKSGKTYRQENLEKQHAFPIGALVEIIQSPDDPSLDPRAGIRLRISTQTRDCDGTPLYSLGIPDDEGNLDHDLALIEKDTYPIRLTPNGLFHGFSEENLKLINDPGERHELPT